MYALPAKELKPKLRARNARNRAHLAQSSASVSNQAVQGQRRDGLPEAGGTNDAAEAEADRISDRVMSGGPATSIGSKPSGSSKGAFGASRGRPLDPGARAFFEPHFADLSRVRVHDDGGTAATADSIGARAYTTGSDIGFAPGEYAPHSSEGRRLLGHELAHVAQGGDTLRRKPNDDLDDQPPAVVGPKPISLMTDFSAPSASGASPYLSDQDLDAMMNKYRVENELELDDDKEVGRFGPYIAMASTKAPAAIGAGTIAQGPKILEGSMTPKVLKGAAAMQERTGFQTTSFGEGNLEGVEEVTILAEGSHLHAEIGDETYSADQLAEDMVESGWKGGTVRLSICYTALCEPGGTPFAQQLANKLSELGAESAVVAPQGKSNIVEGETGLPQVRPPVPRGEPRADLLAPGEGWDYFVANTPEGWQFDKKALMSPAEWKSAGVGGVKMAALIGLSIIHARGVAKRAERERNETGYAPYGPTGNRAYDFGAWILDPSDEAGRSVPFSQRFDMAKWRKTIKDVADSRKPGEYYYCPWQTSERDRTGEVRVRTFHVRYKKGVNGYWYTISGDSDDFPPDLNKVIDENVSDEELRQYLELPLPGSDDGLA